MSPCDRRAARNTVRRVGTFVRFGHTPHKLRAVAQTQRNTVLE